MIRLISTLVCASIFLLSTDAQDRLPSDITIFYYNVDNLFDITDGPGDADDEYHPGGRKAWDSKRYDSRISSIVKNISGAGDIKHPDIIGLGGVENRSVVEDILNDRRLRRAEYSVSMIESGGMGVALLAKKDIATIRDISRITIDSTFTGNNTVYDYDIIYVLADIKGPGQCHIFVCDCSGTESSYRQPANLDMGVAIALRKSIDEIFNFERDARIIILGTFNAEPTDRSMMTALNAANKRKNMGPRDLYNLFYDSHNIDGLGTYRVNQAWQMLDQIIVSSSLMNKASNYLIEPSSGKVYLPEEIENDISMLRSPYEGDEYTGSASSHLPVYCVIKRNEY